MVPRGVSPVLRARVVLSSDLNGTTLARPVVAAINTAWKKRDWPVFDRLLSEYQELTFDGARWYWRER